MRAGREKARAEDKGKGDEWNTWKRKVMVEGLMEVCKSEEEEQADMCGKRG